MNLYPINLSDSILADEINKEFNPDEIVDKNKFVEFIVTLPQKTEIYVLKDKENIYGCATLIIEQKMIHNFSKVGHIEDVFIRPQFRKQGYGKSLLLKLVNTAKYKGCYKVILDCADELVEFYEKCDFEKKNIQMAKYFKS